MKPKGHSLFPVIAGCVGTPGITTGVVAVGAWAGVQLAGVPQTELEEPFQVNRVLQLARTPKFPSSAPISVATSDHVVHRNRWSRPTIGAPFRFY